MLIPFVLFFVVACARPIGPIPPLPDPTQPVYMLNPFESPLYTPDIPNFASPIVDDIDIDADINPDIDVSFPPNIPESSHFPVISFTSTPSASIIASASIPPRISPASSQTFPPVTSTESTTPPTLVTPSSTPITTSTTPSPPPILPTPSPKQLQSPKIRETPSDKRATITDTPPETPQDDLRDDKKRRTTNPSSITTPQISPSETSNLSTPPPTNNPRVTNESTAPMQPEISLGPDGLPPNLPSQSPLPPPIMSQRVTCFPASSTVTLNDGSVVPMRELAIGDFVHVGNGTFSRVHMFTHRVDDIREEFVRFTTDSRSVLTVSGGHYVYVGAVLKPARKVSVGDYLPLGEGGFTTVVNVETVFERGLYNPQTEAGDIVVDGIKASVYTEAVKPAIAHSALLPFRVAFSVFGITTKFADRGFPESVPLTLRSLLSET